MSARPGDLVRVTFEAYYSVSKANNNPMAGQVCLATVPGHKIEVLKPPVAVGEVLTPSDLFTLPHGSIVRRTNTPHAAPVVKVGAEWLRVSDHYPYGSGVSWQGHFKILHLPGES